MNKELNSIGINKKPEDTTVVVAMSGGVDSSTVAESFFIIQDYQISNHESI
jgi:predicted PP-loop superfamily ATPase